MPREAEPFAGLPRERVFKVLRENGVSIQPCQDGSSSFVFQKDGCETRIMELGETVLTRNTLFRFAGVYKFPVGLFFLHLVPDQAKPKKS